MHAFLYTLIRNARIWVTMVNPLTVPFNRGIVRRITSDWDPATVTWNNKPSVTNMHQLKLHSSNSLTQDYENQDVTHLVQDMIDYPSYGILIKMNDEVNYYKSLILGSCLNAVESLRPKLVVTYSTNASIEKKNLTTGTQPEVETYPNPASDLLTFEFTDFSVQDQIQISVYSITGQLLRSETTTSSNSYVMDIASLNNGIYFFKAESKNSHNSYSGKFMKQ
ncbi:MAG: T9SS type A sorting domain-containing protein [Chitinophagaceae bacterium]|nr:T9SS type A sorting domain-containing protein [Chitinophagaceae bacterium]